MRAIWHIVVLIAACGVWLIPSSWHFAARHDLYYLILLMLISGIGIYGALVGGILEAISLLIKFEPRAPSYWLRLLWLILIVIHLVAGYLSTVA